MDYSKYGAVDGDGNPVTATAADQSAQTTDNQPKQPTNDVPDQYQKYGAVSSDYNFDNQSAPDAQQNPRGTTTDEVFGQNNAGGILGNAVADTWNTVSGVASQLGQGAQQFGSELKGYLLDPLVGNTSHWKQIISDFGEAQKYGGAMQVAAKATREDIAPAIGGALKQEYVAPEGYEGGELKYLVDRAWHKPFSTLLDLSSGAGLAEDVATMGAKVAATVGAEETAGTLGRAAKVFNKAEGIATNTAMFAPNKIADIAKAAAENFPHALMDSIVKTPLKVVKDIFTGVAKDESYGDFLLNEGLANKLETGDYKGFIQSTFDNLKTEGTKLDSSLKKIGPVDIQQIMKEKVYPLAEEYAKQGDFKAYNVAANLEKEFIEARAEDGVMANNLKRKYADYGKATYESGTDPATLKPQQNMYAAMADGLRDTLEKEATKNGDDLATINNRYDTYRNITDDLARKYSNSTGKSLFRESLGGLTAAAGGHLIGGELGAAAVVGLEKLMEGAHTKAKAAIFLKKMLPGISDAFGIGLKGSALGLNPINRALFNQSNLQ